ncbi:TRAP transporter large permease subunit [Billgrantia gudaonensis]|uniref:TRAP transporter large permease subunit n=1 Tax=Billgrantia gudaonensis TaxID=376427 RepID=A0A3S0NHM9_9GAMM|nr:TRAP transporter large permease subunit [Halomonas gudaonensis]
MAIPFSNWPRNLMAAGGISAPGGPRQSIVGGLQGGLAMTCVLTCMLFAAVSGSSVATTFAIGSILIPAMVKHDYPQTAGGFHSSVIVRTGRADSSLDTADPLRGQHRPPSAGCSSPVSAGLLIGSALLIFLYLFCKVRGYGLRDQDDQVPFTAALARLGGAADAGGGHRHLRRLSSRRPRRQQWRWSTRCSSAVWSIASCLVEL